MVPDDSDTSSIYVFAPTLYMLVTVVNTSVVAIFLSSPPSLFASISPFVISSTMIDPQALVGVEDIYKMVGPRLQLK
jgi:hypothetical protein